MSMSRPMSRPMPRSMSSRLDLNYTGIQFDSDAEAFLEAADITDSVITAAIESALVLPWKDSGQWGRTVAIYPWVGGSASSHKWNLKNPTDTDAANRITFAGTMTHDANGITTNGSTSVGNTHIDLNLQLPQYSLSIGFYNRTASGPGAGDYALCGANTNAFLDIYGTDKIYVDNGQKLMNGTTYGSAVTGVSSWQGLLGFAQNGPSSMSFYRNTTRIYHDTTEVRGYWSNAGTIANRKLWLFANNNNGSVVFPLDARNLAFCFISRGMNQTLWDELSDIVGTFQTALGRNV